VRHFPRLAEQRLESKADDKAAMGKRDVGIPEYCVSPRVILDRTCFVRFSKEIENRDFQDRIHPYTSGDVALVFSTDVSAILIENSLINYM